MPTSTTSSSATSARPLPPPGGTRHSVYAQHSSVSSAVSTTSGQEMPSTPRWKRRSSPGTQDTST